MGMSGGIFILSVFKNIFYYKNMLLYYLQNTIQIKFRKDALVSEEFWRADLYCCFFFKL